MHLKYLTVPNIEHHHALSVCAVFNVHLSALHPMQSMHTDATPRSATPYINLALSILELHFVSAPTLHTH